MNGYCLVDVPYKLDFREDFESKLLCKKMPTSDVAKFGNAVSKDYCLEMYYDGLSIWRFVVKVDKARIWEQQILPLPTYSFWCNVWWGSGDWDHGSHWMYPQC